jgi:acyl-[acyl-carrier-protein]-phospholipid O-acyltransferase/long-chain-fatty-acid--[acyl-carrier-protein] ligase
MTTPSANRAERQLADTNGQGDIPVARSAACDRLGRPHEDQPELYRDPSFWGMTATQFLGAFNDNLFKQLILLLSILTLGFAVPAEHALAALWAWSAVLLTLASLPAAVPMSALLAFAALGFGEAADRQGLAMFVFAAPFLLFTGLAGFLSDRYSKRVIVVSCKVAEIAIMALAGLAFYAYSTDGRLWPLYVVLFLMATHSAFFGPAKYGILPELLRPRDLPRANGFMLMTLFLAIIFGTVVAGVLLEFFRDQLWVASACCLGIAIVGTITSLLVRPLPPADPQLRFQLSALAIPGDMRRLLWQDRPLLAALTVSSVFWLLAGLVPPAVNALGKIELEVGDGLTSVLTGTIGVGIAIGCVVGGITSGGQVDFRLLRVGSAGMLVCLVLLAVPGGGDVSALKDAAGKLVRLPGIGESRQWLGFWGSLPLLLLLGAFTGLFAVPLQVFMQSRPPNDCKGRMIAVLNQANWVGIIISAGLYSSLAWLVRFYAWPQSAMFIFIALLTLPIALFYRPKNEILEEKIG